MPGVLGLIPAKGGSTRLARKNLRLLGGRPLLAWAAQAARESGIIDRLVVSTEDAEVASTARSLGIEVPFERPAALARDPAGVSDVALHALECLEGEGAHFDTIIVLLPTCPLRAAEDVSGAYRVFRNHGACFVLSVSPFDHTPFAALSIGGDGRVSPVFPQYFGRKSQDLPAAHRPNGAVHVMDAAAFRTQRTYIGSPLFAYVMPPERSIDIDTELDLMLAEALVTKGAERA